MNITPDKLKHIKVGGGIAFFLAFTLCITTFLIPGLNSCFLDPQGIGFLIGGPVVGIYKELKDKYIDNGLFSWGDVVATMIGAFAGSVSAGILFSILLKLFF